MAAVTAPVAAGSGLWPAAAAASTKCRGIGTPPGAALLMRKGLRRPN